MVLQNSADRQTMITVMKKMILRIKAAMVTSSRHPNQSSKVQESIKIQNEGVDNMRAKYVTFIKDLFVFFSNCFFDGASFSKRSIALECLQDLIMHMNEHVKELKGEKTAEKLIQCFHDSFENNKNIALEILKTFPDEVTQLKDRTYVKDFLETTLQLTRSHKPPDSITAGYHVKYLLLSEMSHQELLSILINELN